MADDRTPPWLKPTVDYGPLAVFFVAYALSDLMVATGALIAATTVALVLSLWVTRRVPVMPLVTAVVVAIFGGLTLWFDDLRFVKMKPTVVQGLFSLVLLGGLAVGRPLLKPLLGTAWPMDREGWRHLTFRFAFFFAAMAVLNEGVWRTQSTDVWVAYKVFGIMGLTIVFALAQAPLMKRHHLAEEGSRREDPAE